MTSEAVVFDTDAFVEAARRTLGAIRPDLLTEGCLTMDRDGKPFWRGPDGKLEAMATLCIGPDTEGKTDWVDVFYRWTFPEGVPGEPAIPPEQLGIFLAGMAVGIYQEREEKGKEEATAAYIARNLSWLRDTLSRVTKEVDFQQVIAFIMPGLHELVDLAERSSRAQIAESAQTEFWPIVEKMTARMGYDTPGFVWDGPLFKPENKYLTAEGYPLGTTCWYVYIECKGMREVICADTPAEAVRKAESRVYELEGAQ